MSPISAAMCSRAPSRCPVRSLAAARSGVGAGLAQRGLAVLDSAVEDLDQAQRGGHVSGPRLGQLEYGQLPATGHAEQIRHRARVAEGLRI